MLEPRSDLTSKPGMASLDDLRAWFRTARPGDRVVDHHGHLAVDRVRGPSEVSEPDRCELVAAANTALALAERGELQVVQQRLKSGAFCYLSVRAKPIPRPGLRLPTPPPVSPTDRGVGRYVIGMEKTGDLEARADQAPSVTGRGPQTEGCWRWLERWITTRAIQEAVRGRETEVLEALGIAWEECGQHLSCPYPDHADENPSPALGREEGQGLLHLHRPLASIFDVVMRLEGLDVEPAKLRVAELLGRHDLIKARAGERHQPMDAASLLRPPADQRDRSHGAAAILPSGSTSALIEVPMPSTPVIGWRALAYYDAPAKKGGQPKLVGHYPGAVFGTLAPGRAPPRRIGSMCNPTARARPSSACRTDGRPRDAKKSATLKEGQNAAGCVVLWGDPAKAPHLVLGEGIETAAALALARQPEIEAGEVAVAAALSTAGHRLIPAPGRRPAGSPIAAHRDEDRPADDRGLKAGERPRALSPLPIMSALMSGIVLPGEPDEDVDWLDSCAVMASTAVRVGLDVRRSSCRPPQEEIEAARRCADRAGELAEIENSYPLPTMESMTLDYQHTRSR